MLTRARARRSRWTVVLAATALLGGTATATSTAASAAEPSAPVTPVRSCESLLSVSLEDVVLEDVTLEDVTVVSAVPHPGDDTTPASCRVTAISTHPPAEDEVRIWVALPTGTWNGRFQGVGGGGFSGGSEGAVLTPLRAGYAAASTDTGHTGGRGSFALDENGELAWQLIEDNAHVGIHEAAVVGKALTTAFYGRAPQYSYFNGCSTGGRQGLSEAQRYPGDYDGIVSGAPAINWTKLHVAQMWGQLQMLETGNALPQCEFALVNSAAVAACDTLDGVRDGVLGDPDGCTFDPSTLVGTVTECGTFTEADAQIVRSIWGGPTTRDGDVLWYGLEPGASFSGLNNTVGDPPAGSPFGTTLDWWRYFLTQDPEWDWRTLTAQSFEEFWEHSNARFGEVFATDDPDLSEFADRGGKIVMWHGWNDNLIYPRGTIDYYERVVAASGGREETDEFLRLFMAPGVGHCRGGPGPEPTGLLDAVVRWVEHGEAPETLLAQRVVDGAVVQSRPLCQYPLVARYRGTGSTDEAGSFSCAADFGNAPLQERFDALLALVDELRATDAISRSSAAGLRDRAERAARESAAGSEVRTLSYLRQFVARAQNQLRHSPDVRDRLTTAARELVVALEALEQQEASAP